MRVEWLREPARLLFHLDVTTWIVMERWEGVGLADGGFTAIPTGSIPLRLRAPGSRFVVVCPCIAPEPGDSIEELAGLARSLRIQVEAHPDA